MDSIESKEMIHEVKDEEKTKYTDEEKEVIRQNRERITEELNMYLEIINRCFGFFGFSFKLDEEVRNKINIYDANNELVFEKKYEDTDGIIGAEGMSNLRLRLCFKLLDGSLFEYWLSNNKHHFSVTGDEEHNFSYGLEVDTNYSIVKGISVWSINPDDEYTIKKLEASSTYFRYELDNAFGPYGNYVDGTTRTLSYNSANNNRLGFHMQENVWPDDGSIIHGNEKGFYSFDRAVESPFNGVANHHRLATNIVAHPRNREAINYLLKEFDKVLPNVSRYFVANVPFLRYLLNVPFVEDKATNLLVQNVLNPKCDFKVDLKERKIETPKD